MTKWQGPRYKKLLTDAMMTWKCQLRGAIFWDQRSCVIMLSTCFVGIPAFFTWGKALYSSVLSLILLGYHNRKSQH